MGKMEDGSQQQWWQLLNKEGRLVARNLEEGFRKCQKNWLRDEQVADKANRDAIFRDSSRKPFGKTQGLIPTGAGERYGLSGS